MDQHLQQGHGWAGQGGPNRMENEGTAAEEQEKEKKQEEGVDEKNRSSSMDFYGA